MGRRLDGKVVIVTGAGRGIGRSVALQLAEQGARLVLNDVGCDPEGLGSDPQVVQATLRDVRRSGGEAVGDDSDVAEPGSADTLVHRALDTWGRIDGAAAFAGFRLDRSLVKLTPQELDRVLGVQVRAQFSLTSVLARTLTERRHAGSIVLVSSPGSFFGAARQAATAAAGAAVVALARSAAVELRRHAIRVNVVAPTARTRLTEDLPLFQRLGPDSMSPDHVAPAVTFLLSDEARDVSGEVVGVAGGRLYTLRSRESSGAFSERRPFTPEEIAAVWDEVTRGG